LTDKGLALRFLEEYPNAANRLARAVDSIAGKGRYLDTSMEINRGKSELDKMVWVEVTFFKRGDSVRIHRLIPFGPDGISRVEVATVRTKRATFWPSHATAT